MLPKSLLIFAILILGIGGYFFWDSSRERLTHPLSNVFENADEGDIGQADLHPLSIEVQRKKEYFGSEIVIEKTLVAESGYSRFIASYKSDGLKIYALLTVPEGEPPAGGWPAIVFNHGYIPPEQYITTERYVAYIDGFARQGYVVFKPDFRGHGESEGNPSGAYYSDGYISDVLNAVASVKKYKDVNSAKIGMWGHSMGGHLTLRSMVISGDIKAGVIWAGVVGSYEEMINNWRRRVSWAPSQAERQFRRPGRQDLLDKYGTPEQNPNFWNSISPIKYVSEISGPVQLHHGTSDESVPWEFSQSLKNALEQAGEKVEYFTYEGSDHNLSGAAFNLAMARSVEFFNKYLK